MRKNFSKKLDEITLYDVVEAVDGDSIFRKCGLGLANCNAQQPCPMHNQFAAVRKELIEMCRKNPIDTLMEDYNAKVYNR